MKTKIALIGLMMLLPCILWLAWDVYATIQFDKNCGNYLKMAGDATNVETARVRLGKALEYLERTHLTEGNTGVFINYPENDLGVWYTNLKEAYGNLSHFPANSTESDVANTLVKLRETLIDHEGGGDVLTLPAHIHVVPHQNLYMFGIIALLPVGVLGSFLFYVVVENSC